MTANRTIEQRTAFLRACGIDPDGYGDERRAWPDKWDTQRAFERIMGIAPEVEVLVDPLDFIPVQDGIKETL